MAAVLKSSKKRPLHFLSVVAVVVFVVVVVVVVTVAVFTLF